MKTIKISLAVLLIALACSNSSDNKSQSEAVNASVGTSLPAITDYAATLPLEKIKMPAGFSIQVYAEVPDARSMALSPSGVLYVGNRDGKNVYAVKDTDGDYKADKRWVVATGLNMPNGVAFRDGTLYIAEVSRITKIEKVDSKLDNPGTPVVVNDTYPG
jgi:glucose/arabinose dehydrogenase